jgi:predicted neuraminidase
VPATLSFPTLGFARRLLCVVVTGALLLAFDLGPRGAVPGAAQAVWPDAASLALPLRFQAGGHIPMPAGVPAAHASTLLPMPAGHASALLAFWFAGTRESAPDVQIAASAFDRASQQWQPARFVVNRQETGGQLGFGLRRLGNPVAWRDVQGRIHLFVVATGLGGWAAGRIMHLRQHGAGQSLEQLAFEPMRVLPLSWLWNTSHLVRAMPLPLADGGMVLPVYFELGKKYPVALRFDGLGEFQGLVRMSSQGGQLQPTLLMRSASDWLALLRDNSPARQIRAVQTSDGGEHWQELPSPPGLRNPDAAIAALALQPQLMLLAHNPRPDTRAVLDLSVSRDGLLWQRVLTLAQGEGSSEYSYPALAWADGSLWVSYTDQRQRIAWQRLTLSNPSSPR